MTGESLVDRYRATPDGEIEYAAAELTATASRLLCQMNRAGGVALADIAERLHVSEDRVIEVLEGDGNIRIAALAKYATALGYRVSFTVSPIGDPGYEGVNSGPSIGRVRDDVELDGPFHTPARTGRRPRR